MNLLDTLFLALEPVVYLVTDGNNMWNYIFGAAQAFGAIAIAVSLFFIFRQAKATQEQTETMQKSHEYSATWQERNKAAELARFYQLYIIDEIFYIEHILKETKLLEEIVRLGKFNEFTASELQSKTGSDSFANDIINKALESKNDDIFKDAYFAHKHGVTPYDDSGNLLDSIKYDFMKCFSSLLNSMEYFSMCFVTGIADESVVYQSLHQSFLKCVHMLSWMIASSNINPKNKYYTNLIHLHNLWAQRDGEREQMQNSLVENITKIKK